MHHKPSLKHMLIKTRLDQLRSNIRMRSNKSDSIKCKLPDTNKCQPEEFESERQPQIAPCTPDCTKSQNPKLQPRNCLPWEKAAEQCPSKMAPRILETECCKHICEPYTGQDIIDKFTMSACEFKRFLKCSRKTKDAEKCINLKMEFGLPKKEYPMMHAVRKKYLAGAPFKVHKHGHTEIVTNKN